jgi:ferredoxin
VQTKTMTVGVLHERCMGAGNCAEVSPKYFDQSDTDGTVVLLQEQIDDGDESSVQQAADVCPVSAILINK